MSDEEEAKYTSTPYKTKPEKNTKRTQSASDLSGDSTIVEILDIGNTIETINLLKSQITSLKQEVNALKMPIEIKNIITNIPTFSGEKKELDSFINICDLYHELAPTEIRPSLILIIKTKIIGDALAKISPISTLTTWAQIKARLKEKIFKKVSLEYAQEDLNSVSQYKDEPIEKYGTRVKAKLRNLNDAIKNLTEEQAEITVLRKMNEKLAISKFEQNLHDNTVRILVSATQKESLDECITIALQKELLEKTKNPNKSNNCSICGMSNHTDINCRRKTNKFSGPANKNLGNDKKPNYNGNNYFRENQNKPDSQGNVTGQNQNYSQNNGRFNNGQNRQFTQGNSNSNNPQNTTNGNYAQNRSSFTNNSAQNRNIKTMSDDNAITVREALHEQEETFQINKIGSTSFSDSLHTKFIVKNTEILIEIPTSISNEKLTFCIDTGAQISIN